MPQDSLAVLRASSAATANYTTTAVDLGVGQCTPANGYAVRLLCTAASGTTPTMDVVVQHSSDNSAWTALCTFEQMTTTGEKYRRVQSPKRYLRLSTTIGGTTPSFTHAVEFTAAVA